MLIEWSLQLFAHATTAELLWHVQKSVVIPAWKFDRGCKMAWNWLWIWIVNIFIGKGSWICYGWVLLNVFKKITSMTEECLNLIHRLTYKRRMMLNPHEFVTYLQNILVRICKKIFCNILLAIFDYIVWQANMFKQQLIHKELIHELSQLCARA